MVRIAPFTVEQWMDKYETTPGVLNIAETCAASVSIDDLINMSTETITTSPLNTKVKLTYGPIRGSQTLRERVASHCSTQEEHVTADDILITQGAIGANFLTLYTLIGPGDHVICVYPTYQQLYEIPRSVGAEVSLWRLKPEDSFVPNLDDLQGLIQDNTKMIIINNPNNPTGVPIPTDVLRRIARVAEERDLILFSDEVYRPLFHGGAAGQSDIPVPATTLGYSKTIVTGSMSKGYALAGIRVGWIATKNKDIREAIASARDYTTISVSQLDDQIASYALSPGVRQPLIARNMSLARKNAALVKALVDKHSSVLSWVEPKAGTTAFVQVKKQGKPVNDVDFCKHLLETTKVFFVPGSHCFGGGEDFAGYVRIGYVCETEVLQAGLEKFNAYIEEHLM